MAQRYHNPKWILISPAKQPFRVETCHSTSNIPYYARSLFTDIPRAIPPAVSEWQRVTESERHYNLSLSVSDPLQRDANQVHLPATQRLLAAHHASEQRGRSLQLPRYRHEVTNYHMLFSLPARVSGNVWSASARRCKDEDRGNVAPGDGGVVTLHSCKCLPLFISGICQSSHKMYAIIYIKW